MFTKVEGRAGSKEGIRVMPILNFKGKALVQNFHLLVPFHELRPVKAKSLTAKPSLHDNLVVHGDNLKALKALLPYYHGAVKCIYIDPPLQHGQRGLGLQRQCELAHDAGVAGQGGGSRGLDAAR